jgi:hypothetical protein
MDTALKRIYASIDCLLDVRLGILNTIDPEFGSLVASNSNYYTRELDLFETPKFGSLDVELYKQFKTTLPEQVIRNSPATKMNLFILQLMTMYINETINTPYATEKVIDVNLYPYVFSDGEKDILKENIGNTFNNLFEVNLVYISNENLSVSYCDSKYKSMIMYDYISWLNLYGNQIKLKPARGLAIFVPRINTNRALTAEEEKTFVEVGLSPFQYIEKVFTPLISISHLAISFYCIDCPFNKDEYND